MLKRAPGAPDGTGGGTPDRHIGGRALGGGARHDVRALRVGGPSRRGHPDRGTSWLLPPLSRDSLADAAEPSRLDGCNVLCADRIHVTLDLGRELLSGSPYAPLAP
jgi:hypothetical protein